MDLDAGNIGSSSLFPKNLLIFKKSTGNSIYSIYHSLVVKVRNRLGLDSSHLRQHKFRRNFCRHYEPILIMHSGNRKYRTFSPLGKLCHFSHKSYECIKQYKWLTGNFKIDLSNLHLNCCFFAFSLGLNLCDMVCRF